MKRPHQARRGPPRRACAPPASSVISTDAELRAPLGQTPAIASPADRARQR